MEQSHASLIIFFILKVILVYVNLSFFSDLQQEEVAADDSNVPEWDSPYFVGESTTPSNQGRKRGSFKKVCLLHCTVANDSRLIS